MSVGIRSSTQKLDLSKLGQFYSPIDIIDYGPSQTEPKQVDTSPISPTLQNNLDEITCSPNIINNKKNLKVKFKNVSTKSNDSFSIKKNNVSRNDNNTNEITTTISTFDDKTILTNITSSIDEKNRITKLKELMICFLCHEKVVHPKICPNCYKIVCEECIKKWIINFNNKNCFYCNNNISLDKMITIPIINNISNILNKTATDIKNDSSLVLKQLSSRIKNIKNNNVDSSRTNASCYTKRNNNNINQKSPHNSLDLRNCLKNIKHRKFPNSISEPRKPNISQNNIVNTEHCHIHQDQFLFYYCVDCEKSYCRTCFVFFGDEKNRHNGHKIIDYDKFKDKNNFEILKQIKELKDNIDKINVNINQCEYIKNCYNHEKQLVNKYINSFIINFNEKIDENIKKINDLIIAYKNHIQQINKERDTIKNLLTNKSVNNINLNFSEINILNDAKKINNLENLNDIDVLANLSPKLFFNLYHTDLKHFDIIEKNFRFKTKLKDSKYNLGILRKGNEVQIYIYSLIEKEKPEKILILPYIYLKRKNTNWEIIELKESLEYNGHNYFIKRFNPETFCELNSYIKIKGILFESFFM